MPDCTQHGTEGSPNRTGSAGGDPSELGARSGARGEGLIEIMASVGMTIPLMGERTQLKGSPRERRSAGEGERDQVAPRGRIAVRRCSWGECDPLLQEYHDKEWGVPERDGRKLWEKLMLDGFQAGLAWITILRKREAFRKAFKGFDPERVARFGPADVARLLQDPGIVRSRAKIEATVAGARAFLAMKAEGIDFSTFLWDFAGGRQIQNTGTVLAKTPLSERVSIALKERGFKFVGPVIVYAWMQASGIVNDHATDCFRRSEVRRLDRS